jgi:CHAT domain-containing protein/tetratricopeptide (TPR) repeat protein
VTMQTEHSPFPSDETLAAYIDGRLDEETRKRVVEHMAECEECFDVVMGAGESRSAITPLSSHSRTFLRRPYIIIPAAAAAAIAVIVSFQLLQRVPSRKTTGIAALAAAAPQYRNIEGRLSGFPYRAMKQPTRGRTEDDTDNWRLLGVAAEVKAAADAKPSVENLHALGVSYLLAGHWTEAIQKLESAVERDSHESDVHQAIEKTTNGQLLNDLSAAYLAAARHNREPARIVAAVECADRAWGIARSPEATWNRAMAYEAMHLREKARGAWQEYLRLDPSSSWSEEASAHLSAIESQGGSMSSAVAGRASQVSMICASSFEYRQRVETVLFGRWGDAILADDAEAAKMVAEEIAGIGGALAECNGDYLVRDTLRASTVVTGDAKHRLAVAHQQFAEALRLYHDREIQRVSTLLQQATTVFTALDSPYINRVTLLSASVAYYRNEYDECEAIVSPLIDRLRAERRYPALLAHALWVRGSTRAARALAYEAIGDYDAALDQFRTLREQEAVAGIETLLASQWEDVGDEDAAWAHRIAALQIAAHKPPSMQTLQLLLQCADIALRERQFAAAKTFLDEQLRICTRPEWRDMRVRALLRRAEVEQGAGKPAAASSDRREAFVVTGGIASEEMRLFTSTSLEYVRARAAEVSDDPKPFDAAVRYARAHQSHVTLAQLLLAAAQMHAQRGERDEARRDVGEALQEIDRPLLGSRSAVQRAAYLDGRHQLYGAAIQIAVDLGDEQWAFALNERSREGVLRSASTKSRPESPSISPTLVGSRLPLGAVVVEFAELPDRLVIWLIRRDRTFFYQRSVKNSDLTAAVRQFVESLLSSDRLPNDDGLFDIAVKPWIHDVADADTLFIVCDGILTEVPFAALHGNGRTLLERFRISSMPAAALLFRARATRRLFEGTVLVAAPGAPLGVNLDELPAAAAEAKHVGGMYSQSTLLDSYAATKNQFIAGMRKAAIVHYAGHAIESPSNPALAALVFRGDDGSASYLYAHEIATLNLESTRLVILAACATSAGSDRRMGGLSNLSRAFIAAGASSVVGSLWPIRDDVAARLTIDLHRRLREGESPHIALRNVQLASMNNLPPRDWAALMAISNIGAL